MAAVRSASGVPVVAAGRYLVAGGLLLFALVSLIPNHKHEQALQPIRLSSVPSKLNHSTEWQQRTTLVPRASRNAVSPPVRPRVAPKARTAPTAPQVAQTGDWQALVASLSWDVPTAFRVVKCESNNNPNARNPRSSATGLFQILHGPIDALANVRLAFSMWLKRGWQPWNASRGCWG